LDRYLKTTWTGFSCTSDICLTHGHVQWFKTPAFLQ
jgi:hypothetical protein